MAKLDVRPFLPVTFTDVQLIEAGTEPPFPDHTGTYEEPGVMIPGGKEPVLPKDVTCPGSLVIYASDCQLVANCAGFKGPGAGNNAVVAAARAAAFAAAAKIPCKEGCKKRELEIWSGWDCGNNPLSAVGAVEVKIFCDVEL
jgi:hypothetical protein